MTGSFRTKSPAKRLQAVKGDHVQSSKPRDGGTTSFKRQKTRRPKQRSQSAIDSNRKAGRNMIDVSGCNEQEARRRLDDFWAPPELSFGKSKPARMKRSKTPDSTSAEGYIDSTICRRHSDPSESSKAPKSLISLPGEGFERKPPQAQRPGTPQSLPRRNSRSVDTTGKESLDERMKTLFLKEAAGEGRGLIPSTAKTLELERLRMEQIEREERARQAAKVAAEKAARELRLRRKRPLKSIVEPLIPTWDDRVVNVAESRDLLKVVTKSREGTELRVKDFATLLGHHSWLNDEIINTYIEWIVHAANEAAVADYRARAEKAPTVPRFIAHNSFFYENLKNKGASSTERLMKRKKAPGILLMEVDSVFVPICSGSHWTIGVVRPAVKTIEYFDSMGNRPRLFFEIMRTWLKFQLKEKYIAEEWEEPSTACARQSNGYDCGVFVCTNAFCVALGLETSCYREHDMTQQRRNIAAVLINMGFNGDFAWNQPGLLS